jgi:hypothetical protein
MGRPLTPLSMNHDKYDDSYIRGILNSVKTVAIVGASANESRPSLFVTKYLNERGYKVFPVNPGRGGSDHAFRQSPDGIGAHGIAPVPRPAFILPTPVARLRRRRTFAFTQS